MRVPTKDISANPIAVFYWTSCDSKSAHVFFLCVEYLLPSLACLILIAISEGLDHKTYRINK